MAFEFILKANISVSLPEPNPKGGCIAADGTKMYSCGNYAIHEATLSPAYDVAAQVNEGYLEVWEDSDRPYGVKFKPDGTRMYIASGEDSCISEYLLSTPWAISTAVFQRKLVLSQYPAGFSISSDGTKVFICHPGDWDLTEYTLSSPWDISSGTPVYTLPDSFLYDFAETPQDCWVSLDGTTCYVLTHYEVGITRLKMATPWDLSTAERFDRPWVGDTDDPDNGLLENGIALSADEQYLYIFGWDNIVSSPSVWWYQGDPPSASEFWGYFRGQSEIL